MLVFNRIINIAPIGWAKELRAKRSLTIRVLAECERNWKGIVIAKGGRPLWELEESTQAPDVAAREKPRFNEKKLNFWKAAGGFALTVAAEQFHLIPPGLATEISNAIEVAALGILWRQGDRTENRDGNRPKD